MSENIAQTVQKVIQDLVAPDMRELKAALAANQKQIDVRFDAVDNKFAGVNDKFVGVNDKFAGVNNKFEGVNDKFEGVNDKFEGLQKQIDQRFDAQDQINNAQFKALMAAIAEVKAQNELNTVQAISALSERVAILESRHQ